ncbi:MAG: PD-(D/E)XK nuclease family protein [Gemmataceae bacterium]|nr:PD-(D/E)XK nuclease family protein [Gemmataceae bacterium]MDW8264918.1 PD-(D/E)XK nuclease family protein [Gemmataceae bacterium]
MPATIQLVCGPAGSGKTRQLRTRYEQQPAIGLWIVPTPRAANAWRTELMLQAPVGATPSVATFQDLADSLVRVHRPEARPLPAAVGRVVLHDLLTEFSAAERLGRLTHRLGDRGFVEQLAKLIAELTSQGVSPGAFLAAAGSDAARACAELYAEYRGRLERARRLDPESRLHQAAELLARGQICPFEQVRRVFVDGFSHFSPVELRLLISLRSLLEEIWIALPEEADSPRPELFASASRTREILTALGATVASRLAPNLDQGRPAGLRHLERQLFASLRRIVRSPDACGLELIQAPGMVGEVRMVARDIKEQLLAGAPAEGIIVAVPELRPYADVVREVFAEYGIPADIDGTEPLADNRAVGTLLRALRLPDEDWPFHATTALLRSNYFRPDWPETAGSATMPQQAEALLRLLGEVRGREAYLRAVAHWAAAPPPEPGDDDSDTAHQQRCHRLAVSCQPFLQRFFRLWENAPADAPLAEHVTWLRQFADALGLSRVAAEEARDAVAVARLWSGLERWVETDAAIHGPTRPWPQARFRRALYVLAQGAGVARTPRGPGRVRILAADEAHHLEADHLYVLGLGEGSFPRLPATPPLLDAHEQAALRASDIPLAGPGDRRADELLLFYRLLTRPRRRLVLSYPAVDPSGQMLLPSSFLEAVCDCFTAGAIPSRQRKMLIEWHEGDAVLGPAEARVLAARHGATTLLGGDVAAHLADAAEMIRCRFTALEHTVFDGWLRQPEVVAAIGEAFGPTRPLSPTALDDYIACPFRFFARHVLRLLPLDEPEEGIDAAHRGSAFHRALARLHRRLQQANIERPTPEVAQQLHAELARAVEEYARRAASDASRTLWQLEGQRLQRLAGRYEKQWSYFLEPWQRQRSSPQPRLFEAAFGITPGEASFGPLIIREGDVAVRIAGRIDRIDVTPLRDGLGYWVIDYKTGRASNYSAGRVASLEQLQLPLYALAVEEVLLAGQRARPLGLTYWLVLAEGPKAMLPGHRHKTAWLTDPEAWARYRQQLRAWVIDLVQRIRRGEFPLHPRYEHCTSVCPYSWICRIAQSRSAVERKDWSLPLPVTKETEELEADDGRSYEF